MEFINDYDFQAFINLEETVFPHNSMIKRIGVDNAVNSGRFISHPTHSMGRK